MSTASVTPAPVKETRLQKFENFLKDVAQFIPEHLPAIVAGLTSAIESVKAGKSVASDITSTASTAASVISVADPSAAPLAQAADAVLDVAVAGEQAIAAAVKN